MKKQLFSFKVLCLFLVMAFSMQAFAQGVKITGKVTDATDGKSLPGVTVLIKGTTKGTTTDIDGNYTLDVTSGATLVFSYIGYTSQEVAAGAQKVLNIVLSPSSTGLSEVVVIGYGQVKKSDLTGSLTTLSTKDFNRGAISSPQQLILGKSAGVVITSSGGAPGSGSTIRIRGNVSMSANRDPLIVIDGVPLEAGVSGLGNSLTSINPNDIASFTVLKDASATAIYGSRASAGVIIITTKRGESGKKFEVSYNGNISISKAPKFIEVFTGDEMRTLAADLLAQGLSGLNAQALKRLGTSNTDWQKEIYQTAIGQDHNLAVQGTFKTMPYRASYGYTNQDGILKTTNLQRNSLGIVLDPTFLDDHLKVNINLKGSISKENFGNTGAVGSAVAYDPTQPVMNGNTRFGGYHTWVNLSDTLENGQMNPNGDPNPIGVSNPVALLEQTDNTSEVKRSIGNVQFDYKLHFLPELRANLNLGYDYSNTNGHNNAFNDAAFTFRNGPGQKIDYTQKRKMELLDFTLNYEKDLSGIRSKVSIMGGYSWQHFQREGTNFSRKGDDLPPYIDSSQYINENFLVSFFGRLNYSLMDKYLLTFTLRDDGSSRFSKDNRWGLFPSAAFAWKVNEEAFLKNVKAITQLKLRLGYGTTGQQDIGEIYYPYLAVYKLSDPSASYQFGSTFYPTLRPNPYDLNIKWESTTTTNIGLDFGFANDRITGAIDVYKKLTKDLINFIPIPAGSNFSNFLTTNVGNLENKGIELSLQLKPVVNSEWFWSIGYNIAYNENKITKLTKTDDPNYTGVDGGTISGGVGNYVQNQNVGFPVNSYFVFQQVYGSNGLPIEGLYVDLSGNGGTVTSSNTNKYHYKQPDPKVTMGLSTNVSYKKVDLAVSSRINLGNYVYNNLESERARYTTLYNQSGFFNNLPTMVNDAKFTNAQYWSDYYVENASFFRLDNVSLGYNFDKLFTQKLKARLSFTVNNALVITKYKGLDPEVDGGIDNNIYPRPRVYVLGVNVTF
ncbi:MAG: SusC/RagA family TonB-linked outer membrane protein [Bacteroidales bacterium]|nr:SusC/RagA family TonB-linked outer membrane protein [Bacteroidales bacterium]